MRRLGEAVSERCRSSCAIRSSARRGIERAGGHERARGRAADSGIAMHDQGRGPVPAAREGDEPCDMLLAGRDVAVGRLGDVVHAEHEVLVRGDALGARHQMDVAQQRHDVAGAGFLRRCGADGQASRRES